MAEDCGICLSKEQEIVICWNDHKICGDCYKTCMESARGALKKCAFCREKMFDWKNPQQDPMQPVNQHPVHERWELFENGGGSTMLRNVWRVLPHAQGIERPELANPAIVEEFDRLLNEFLTDDLPDYDGTSIDYPLVAEETSPIFNAWMDHHFRAGHEQNPHRQHLPTRGLYVARMFNPRYHENLGATLRAHWPGFQAIQEWDYMRKDLSIPVLHTRNRISPFGTSFSIERGNLEIDYRLRWCQDWETLKTIEFSEDQLYHSKNWERNRTAGKYKYVGKWGPYIIHRGARDGSPRQRYRLPVPKYTAGSNDYAFGGRCGHCKGTGHRATWELQGQGGVSRRVSRCPCDYEKDYFRKQRIDFCALFVC